MKALVPFILALFIATATFAAELTEADIKAFLADWLAAQNTGAYSRYATMYSNDFAGIRRSGANTYHLNHDAWLKDRKKMFKKKMSVTLKNVRITLKGTIASVTFEQRWESSGYKDIGEKVIDISYINKRFQIVKEEMISSNAIIIHYNTLSDKVTSPLTTSKYTSILDIHCKNIRFPDITMFTGADSAFECKSQGNWRLFKVYDGDERSWLSLSNETGMWSTVDQVITNRKYFFGYFPNIDYSSQVEWRLDQKGTPVALIFRVAVTDPNPNPDHARKDSWLTKLYVIGLTRNEPFFCGTATTNEEARTIADKAAACSEHLLKEPGLAKGKK